MNILGQSTIGILNDSDQAGNTVGEDLGKGVSSVLGKHSQTIGRCLSQLSVGTLQVSVEQRNEDVLILDTLDATKLNNVVDDTESPLLVSNWSIRSLKKNKLGYPN